MTSVFSPGHITCFFHPVRTGDPETTGSRGAGLRLSLGTTVTIEERTDRRVNIVMDGRESDAPVTRRVLSMACPDRGFDVTIENELPVGQGFGMSASGAIAAAACACMISDIDIRQAYRLAHVAEVTEGGGLGDVAAIMSGFHQPVRIRPGLPPYGEVRGSGLRIPRLTLAVVGDKLSTAPVINDPDMQSRMCRIGSGMVDDYIRKPSLGRLFSLSREFSTSLGLESEGVRDALNEIAKVAPAGMCMLGHSVFTTLPEDEVREILGDVPVFSASTSKLPSIIQTG